MLWVALGVQRPAAYDFNVHHQISRIRDTSQVRYLDLDVSSLSAVDQNNVWAVANVLGFQTITTQSGVNSADHIEPSSESVVPSNTGIILHSGNGGRSWAVQRVERGKFLLKVHFTDRMHGWVVDDSNTIFKTENSGRDWTAHETPELSFCRDLQFIDGLCGWTLGDDGKVLHTIDGGQKWSLTEFSVTTRLASLAAVDDKTVWAVGEKGTVYESTDSGSHWRSRGDELVRLLENCTDCAVEFRVVKFANARVGFIFGELLPNHDTLSATAIILKTTNGGKSWLAFKVPSCLGIRSATILNETEAWVVPRRKDRASIFRTRDGGKNWTKIRLADYAEPGEITFIDSRHGWFLESSHTSSDQIFRTDDGGRSWIEIRISKHIVHF